MKRRTVLRDMGAILACLILASGCSNQQPPAPDTSAPAKSSDPAGAAAQPAQPAAPVKLTVGHDTWVGYSGVFIAKELGYFKQAGLEVELKSFSNPVDTLAALASNQLDIGLTTLQNLAMLNGNSDTDIVGVALLDSSNGADAVVAKESIASMADLKGKTVALTIGEVNHMFFLMGLEKAGLSASDVKITSMGGDDAGAAFVAGKVDAAVTWEPWITKAIKSGGHAIFTSKSVPDTIINAVAVHRSSLAARRDACARFIGAVDQGARYVGSEADKAYPVIGKYLSAEADDVKGMLAGDKLYTIADNKQLFGAAEQPGPVYATMKSVVDFAVKFKLVKSAPVPESMFDPRIIR